ncbi:flagellin [Oligoflexaceae bacterium]|nr:flagellin [Oligoflexaceae bacterium]
MTISVDSQKLVRILDQAGQKRSDSLEKLSSGEVFSKNTPKAADRALAEGLEFRLRGLTASKRNVNDAVSMMQTGQDGMNEINNMVMRMKEIGIAASNTAVSDRDRQYLFLEYQALYDEVTRVGVTTEFNGIPLLNGRSKDSPSEMVFRLDAPFNGDDGGEVSGDDDVNVIRFDGIGDVVATSAGLGLRSAKKLLLDGADGGGGISLKDVQDILEPDSGEFSTSFDEAIANLSTQRAVFGAIETRMNKALDYIDVYSENLAAAKSKIADTDYAREAAELAKTSISMQAASGLLAQGDLSSRLTVNLLNSLV